MFNSVCGEQQPHPARHEAGMEKIRAPNIRGPPRTRDPQENHRRDNRGLHPEKGRGEPEGVTSDSHSVDAPGCRGGKPAGSTGSRPHQGRPKAESFLPQQIFCEEHKAQPSQDNVALAQAIADSLSTHRLPVPEPTIFAGDPLKFIDWKMSFMALIDRKPLPPGEKMFYLKNYLIGKARKAVEGYFYLLPRCLECLAR